MTKRNTRNRRHGTNESTKGRVSPIAAPENNEYSMIDLVRSVERLHFCKSGDRKDTVMWADVKKHYKKNTGRVLTTETFNKLAGVNGVSRKELIAGPLAGLLVAEDPAALVLRFKYDATKGDPLINHRFYLEASGAKTSVHHADENISPRTARTSNTVSPSPSETSSSSLSPTCLSSISTDPDTEALSPVSAASPLSSAPLSPLTRDYVTANDNDDLVAGDRSFLTARTSPMTSDWETSPSSYGGAADTETSASSPTHNGSFEGEKTLLNPLEVSTGEEGETTIGGGIGEVLVDMDSSLREEPVKGEEKKMEREEEEKEEAVDKSLVDNVHFQPKDESVKVEEQKMEREEENETFEEGSDKENHVSSTVPVKQSEEETADDVIVHSIIQKAADDVDEVIVEPHAVEEKELDDVIVVPDEVVEKVIVETLQKTPAIVDDDVEQSPVEEKKEVSEPAAVIRETVPTEEVKEVEEQKEDDDEKHLAAGDAPLSVLPQSAIDEVVDATSPNVTTSSSDEHMLTVIERPVSTVPTVEEEEVYKERSEEAQPEDTVEEEKKEDVVIVEKEEEEEPTVEDASAAAAVEVKPKVVEVTSVQEMDGVKEEEKEEKVDDEEKREEQPVKEVESTTIANALEETAAAKKEDTVEKISEVSAAAVEKMETDDSASATTEEPTTMVAAAAVAPLQQVQQQHQAPPPSHEPMTSDDVDMHDILSGGPNRDVHTPSVTAPITLQPKPANRLAQPEDDEEESEVITSQPIVDEADAAPAAAVAAAASPKEDTAATPDLALRRAAPAKKFPCCTIV